MRSEHAWAQSWPGNYCTACGQDDPLEAGMVCPDCRWSGGMYGMDNWEPCDTHKPRPCAATGC